MSGPFVCSLPHHVVFCSERTGQHRSSPRQTKLGLSAPRGFVLLPQESKDTSDKAAKPPSIGNPGASYCQGGSSKHKISTLLSCAPSICSLHFFLCLPQAPKCHQLPCLRTKPQHLHEMGGKAAACSHECRCMELGDGAEELFRALLI